MTNPSNHLEICKGSHDFVTREDGTRGYEAVQPIETVVTAETVVDAPMPSEAEGAQTDGGN